MAKNTEKTAQKAVDDADVDKAGFVIYGRNGDKELCVVAGYTQNRYGNDPVKAYGLIKGSIDDGETSFEGGKREAEEESGISIKKLLGKEAYNELSKSVKNGKGDVKPKQAGGYPKVQVKRAYATPSEFSYTSAVGKTKKMQMYFIELKDGCIEHLQGPLKGPPLADSQRYSEAAPDLHSTVDDYVQRHHLPTLEEMLAVLKTGKIKPKEPAPEGWPDKKRKIIEEPALPKLLKKMEVDSIDGWDDARWQSFCEKAQKKQPDAYQAVLSDVRTLKKFFKESELISDDGFMKFDATDRPLTFFFEGADVIPINTMVLRSARYAIENKPYAEAMWGGPGAFVEPAGNLSKRDAVKLATAAQIAGFFPQAQNQTLEKSKHFSLDSLVDSIQGMVADLHSMHSREVVRNRVHGLAEALKGLQL